jgi:uncharacterized membrane protein
MRKYTGYAYVKKLERCLRKMPYEERLDAVNYYSEYLADAGPEREGEVIARLGPPQRLAAEIRADAALRELNAKAEVAERTREMRKAAKDRRRSKDDYPYGGAGPDGDGVGGGADGYGAGDAGYGDGSGSGGYGADTNGYGGGANGYGAAAGQGGPMSGGPGPAGAGADGEAGSPNLGESFSAAGLGAIGMLAMPVARPLAVLACVLGIFGLVLAVIVVAAIFAVAGALVFGGVVSASVGFMLLPQDGVVTLFLAGTGAAIVGAGLILGVLNSLLGRAIFKGIANLAGRIRHKRVKVRKEIFNYRYTNDRPGSDGQRPFYTNQYEDPAGSQYGTYPDETYPYGTAPDGDPAEAYACDEQETPPYGAAPDGDPAEADAYGEQETPPYEPAQNNPNQNEPNQNNPEQNEPDIRIEDRP